MNRMKKIKSLSYRTKKDVLEKFMGFKRVPAESLGAWYVGLSCPICGEMHSKLDIIAYSDEEEKFYRYRNKEDFVNDLVEDLKHYDDSHKLHACDYDNETGNIFEMLNWIGIE